MDNLLTDDSKNAIICLLEHIASRHQLLKMHREAVEPSQLMIDEYTDLLQRHVNELNALLQAHGLSVQLTREVDGSLINYLT